MPKPKLVYLLPVFQVVMAAALLQWGYSLAAPYGATYIPSVRLVCRGLSAPALLLRMLDPIKWGAEIDWMPRSAFGFDMDDIYFLVGVLVVWSLVGRYLDQRWIGVPVKRRGKIASGIAGLLLLALGVLLFLGGLHDLDPLRYNTGGAVPIGAWLTLLWSAVLVLFAIRGFVAVFRREAGQ